MCDSSAQVSTFKDQCSMIKKTDPGNNNVQFLEKQTNVKTKCVEGF